MIKKIFLTLSILILSYFLISNIFIGIKTIPTEGDSVAYHIPTAKNILRGEILKPDSYLAYYPSIGEILLAIFILLKISLNLFNVLAAICLFISCFFLAKKYNLSKENSFFFAFSITTLNVVLRWLNAQIIDIWLAVFYVCSLLAILNLSKKWQSFLILGIFLGLLLGTKYSAPLFVFILVILFWNKIKSNLNFSNFLVGSFPSLILGLSWYIRNLILVDNPFYPQPFLIFKGYKPWDLLNIHIYQILLLKPTFFLNAIISEISFWSILIFLISLVFSLNYIGRDSSLTLRMTEKFKIIFNNSLFKSLLFLFILNFLGFLVLPTIFRYSNVVSSFRYSLPVFIPGILLIFIIFQKLKKENYLYFLSIVNALVILIPPYRPKITIFIFLITIIIFTIINKLRFLLSRTI